MRVRVEYKKPPPSQWEKKMERLAGARIWRPGMPCSGIWATGKWTRVRAGEDRITSDSEDNTLVAGRGKAGEEGGEGARRRGRVTDGTKENQPQPIPPGARSSLGTWMSTTREEDHETKLRLPSGGCQANHFLVFSSAK